MKAAEKKSQALDAITLYVLENGLGDTGIRTLAKAGGISDRMLIYYFGSKDALIKEILTKLSEGTSQGVGLLFGDRKHTIKEVLEKLDDALALPEFRQAMMLFIEVTGYAIRGIEPHRTAAQEITSFWMNWLDERLVDTPEGFTPKDALALIDGHIVLKLLSQD